MAEKYKLNLRPLAREGAIVKGDKYRFTILTDRLIRMEYQQDGLFVDEPTQTVICRDFEHTDYRVIQTDDSLEIVTEKLHLYYDLKPFSREGLTIQLKEGFYTLDSVWSYGDEPNDLRGTVSTLDGVDGAIELEHGLMSREGYAVVDDSTSAFITEDGWAQAKDWESVDLYFFGYGHDYLGCLRDFYRLSGEVPLLPRFTLGNWWSRYYRYSEKSYLELMERFRREDIPFATAVIDMDWHLVDIPAKYGSGWTGYTWNRELFPDPKRFMDRLHEMGMSVTLNIHPADGVRAHEDAYLPMAKELGVDYENEDKIPFDASSRRFLEAYFRHLHHPQEEQGVDFWWIDWQQGTRGGAKGISTLWLLNHLHFLDSARSGKRPLTFSRYAGIGSHRYPIGFSGDTYSTWESLDFQPYFTANASNVGYGWWSHDIGGHQCGRRDDELAVRWLQLGVFSPIMRLHSTSDEFYGKEPWNYGIAARTVMTDFLRLRHRLIPYLYSMNYLAHDKALPIVRPMYYHHDQNEAYNVPNQYYFGTEMIVCPITKPVDPETLLASFEAWLPEGRYIDFFTGQVYRGGQRLRLCRNLESIPVLVRAGGIVPLAKDYSCSHLENPSQLEIQVFNGADGSFDLYEDNGGEPVITHIGYKYAQACEISLAVEGNADGVIPEERCYSFVVRGVTRPEKVTCTAGELQYDYDEQRRCLNVSLCAPGCREFSVCLEGVQQSVIAAPDMLGTVYHILHRAQIPYSVKSEIYAVMSSDASIERVFGALNIMDMPSALRDALIEQLICDCR